MRASTSWILCLGFSAAPAAAQDPIIGIIDFYGARSVAESTLRQALGVSEGDTLGAVPSAELRRRLEAVPGVTRAALSAICCEQGKIILYVGIAEAGSAAFHFHPAPQDSLRLPADAVEAGEAFGQALIQAVRRGEAAEDESQGHALMRDPAARAVQERFIGFAARDLPLLRAVLARSADSSQRALAAQVIAYAPDKRDVVDDLVAATRDPASDVRNNAVRALAVMAGYAQAHPELGLRVPAEPFVSLLNSPAWTDRNKGSFALMQVTASRDSALLARLRAEALPSLIEMARWKAPGHAYPPLLVLGRAAGLRDDDINAAWERGDREAVIAAAQKLR